MSAAEVGAASGIPESLIVEKFGLRGKHVAAPDEHVSDLAVAAARRLLDESSVDPASIGALVYYGSTWKDFAVWQVAPWIAHRLGCVNAYAVEYDNVSMGTPVALRLAKALLVAEPDLRNVLIVAACRESYLLDYGRDEGRARRGLAAELRGGGRGCACALRRATRRCLLPVRDPHEALDARVDRLGTGARHHACGVPRRHRSHERGRPAARARSRCPLRHGGRRRSRAAACAGTGYTWAASAVRLGPG